MARVMESPTQVVEMLRQRHDPDIRARASA
jgi:hypothetical protein